MNRIVLPKEEGVAYVVNTIAAAIRSAQQQGKSFVWGLPTGSSPIPVYAGLVELYRSGALSFHNVVTFNLDEYYPLDKADARSFYTYTQHHLLLHVNLPQEQVFYPDSSVSTAETAAECSRYDAAIRAAGGFDMLLLGIGTNGHIAFNEPGTPFDGYTAIINLSTESRQAAAAEFGGMEAVPQQAISIGIRHVLEARSVLLTAWGAAKAGIIHQCITGTPGPLLPASCLQQHANCTFVLDAASAALLPEE